jgi:hypothetical protein
MSFQKVRVTDPAPLGAAAAAGVAPMVEVAPADAAVGEADTAAVVGDADVGAEAVVGEAAATGAVAAPLDAAGVAAVDGDDEQAARAAPVRARRPPARKARRERAPARQPEKDPGIIPPSMSK